MLLVGRHIPTIFLLLCLLCFGLLLLLLFLNLLFSLASRDILFFNHFYFYMVFLQFLLFSFPATTKIIFSFVSANFPTILLFFAHASWSLKVQNVQELFSSKYKFKYKYKCKCRYMWNLKWLYKCKCPMVHVKVVVQVQVHVQVQAHGVPR